MGTSSSSRRADDEMESNDGISRELSSDASDEAEASGSDPDSEIASIFNYLVRSGQVRIITTDDHHSRDEYEDMEIIRPPMINPQPDTSLVDKSELKVDVLQASGRVHRSGQERHKSVLQMIEKRRVGMYGHQRFTRGDCCAVASRYLPHKFSTMAKYNHKVFCGTYSKTGSLFLTACQDRNIRLYDTSRKHFRLFKTIQARDVGWSILDTALSRDGNYLIYSSWSECIHLCNIHGEHEVHEALPLCPEERRFCIFSLVFSQDGQELLGGANDGYLYVYDIERKERTLRIPAHEDDVNTVAFADANSQILFSGGDDGLCRVWDRRTLRESDPSPVGTLAGHRDGITYVDPRGDGRHLITNCKDQTIKLWDMRVFSPSEGQERTKQEVSSQHWDYRWQRVPSLMRNSKKRLEGDTSLMTYMGHSVLQTLIRCHFSPEFTTGQRFIYTGCATGRVVVYDVLTGKIKATLQGHHRACVRDVSWHPFRQEIISTSWDGTVGRWITEGINPDKQDDSDCDSESDAHKARNRTHLYNLRPKAGSGQKS